MSDAERISIEDLQTAIERFVRPRIRPDEAEDIVASTIARMWELDLQRRTEELPSIKPPSSELEMPREEALKLSYTIARSQVARYYRLSSRRLTTGEYSLDKDQIVDDRSDVYKSNVTAQLVRELVEILAEFSDRQNEELSEYIQGIQVGPHSPAQRKRVSRLRGEIKRSLEKKIGTGIVEYLGEG